MSYDDDHPEFFSSCEDDQLVVELEKIYREFFPDLSPYFNNESDEYLEIDTETEYPYDE